MMIGSASRDPGACPSGVKKMLQLRELRCKKKKQKKKERKRGQKKAALMSQSAESTSALMTVMASKVEIAEKKHEQEVSGCVQGWWQSASRALVGGS